MSSHAQRLEEMDSTTIEAPISPATDRVLDGLSALARLLDQTVSEVRAMDADFEDRLGQAARQLEVALAENRNGLEEQFTAKLQALTRQWEEERQRLNDERAQLSEQLIQLTSSKAEAETKVEQAILQTGSQLEEQFTAKMQAATQQWEEERQRLNSAKAEAEAKAEQAIIALKETNAKTQTAPEGAIVVKGDVVNNEVQRLESVINEITGIIDDEKAELSEVIRKNAERAQHEHYLRGIQFVLNARITK